MTAGAAYLLEKDSGSWSGYILADSPDRAHYDVCGFAVKIQFDNAWVFLDQVWPSNSEAGLSFGSSLALWASNLVVGSPQGYFYGSESGIVHAFRLSVSEWIEQGWLVASDIAADDSFGTSVSVFQSTVMVGSPFDHNSVGSDTGVVYIYDLADFQAHIFSDGFEFGGPWFWSSTVN